LAKAILFWIHNQLAEANCNGSNLIDILAKILPSATAEANCIEGDLMNTLPTALADGKDKSAIGFSQKIKAKQFLL